MSVTGSLGVWVQNWVQDLAARLADQANAVLDELDAPSAAVATAMKIYGKFICDNGAGSVE
jgi:hypothetical protein